MKFAAIDIGSNSIKLVVVEAAASDSFAVLTREKETVRLGHETLLKGYLDRGAILSATDCIRRFQFEIRAAVERPARELQDCRWDQVTGTSGTILCVKGHPAFGGCDGSAT